MPKLKIRQLEQECDTWKRSITFIKEENINLKLRLSELLHIAVTGDELLQAENFQNRFLRQDVIVDILQNDVAQVEKLMIREIFEDGALIKTFENKLKHTKRNIINAEQQFVLLKQEFSDYITERLF